ncbi:MAG TPA: class I SAM-dependent methyltransferase [Gaiellales bacterium]|jgi:SAM-dependent methyltransferase|nr:class I SAM-dependent methyltransferase [Gaiellales bacterium]
MEASIVAAPDALRAHLHGMWAAVAAPWGEHAEYVDARAAAVTLAMLAACRPGPGERVLELACGPGGAGLAAADHVGPAGEVILSDVVAEMTAIAAARARARGLTNVRTRVLDLESIDEPDRSYDVVLCREGLMFAPDPGRAAREIQRVLRPGGRVAVAVWGPLERNPWLGLVFDAVSAQTGAPVPPPGVPGPFSLGGDGQVAALLTGAGLSDVRLSEVPTPLRAGSFDEWWQRTSALAGPLAKVLAGQSAEARQALRSALQEAVRPYSSHTGAVDIPGLTLVASARR